MATVRDISLIFMFFIGSALIVLLMLLPNMIVIENEHKAQEQRQIIPQTNLPINSSSFIGSWHLFAYNNIRETYTFTRHTVTITENWKKTTHEWTFVDSTKILSIQYPTGWINYKNCNRINNDTIQFERTSVYEFRRM